MTARIAGPVTSCRGAASARAGSVACLVALAACSGARPLAAPAPLAAAVVAASPVGPARWVPVSLPDEPRVSMTAPDGSRLVVTLGMRLVEHADGRTERADERLPQDGRLGVLEVPRHLGGGWVFHVAADSGTRLYRAGSFTGRVESLVKLPFEADDVVAGPDRLLAVSARTRAVVGVDARTGEVLGTPGVPAAASYGGVAFADAWLGAVEADIRGPLVTFDAGDTYHAVRLPMTVPGVFRVGGAVVLGTVQGAFAVEPTGELRRLDGTAAAQAAANGAEDGAGEPMDGADEPPAAPVLGARPLEVAVQRGIPDSPTTALVAANGALARVSLADGRLLAVDPHAMRPGAECQGIRLLAGVGFVCGEDRGATTIYAYRPPLGLARYLTLDTPRRVLPAGNGAIAVAGGCSPRASGAEAAYCIVDPKGGRRDIVVQGDVGAERVVVLSDGRAGVLVPPRFGLRGSLTLVGADARMTTVPLGLDAVPAETRALVEHGLWMDGLVELAPGVIGAWVVGASPFVGVQVSLDGRVTAGTVRGGAERASFGGAFALVTGEQGGGAETTDGGKTWADVALPFATDQELRAAPESPRGCGAVGCSLGAWLRVGWGRAAEGQDLAMAKEPPRPKSEANPFVSWALGCVPTGESETPAEAARRVPQVRPVALRDDLPAALPATSYATLESSAFRPFLGVPSPPRGREDLGFDFGTEDQTVQARGYAWGPRSAPWDRAGTWVVRAADRFETRGSVWSTAPAQSPWADALAASEAFGSEPTHRTSSEWGVVLDPVDDGGVLVMRAGASTSLAVIERDRAPVMLSNGGDFNLDRISGAVRVDGTWYVGHVPGPHSFAILAVNGGTLAPFASYPRHLDDAPARVVRSVRGDALGIWVSARGQQGTRSGGDTWYVHPIDPRDGSAGPPLVVGRDALAHAPPPCEPDADGWVLLHEVNASVARIELVDVPSAPTVARVEARLVAGPSGLCLDSLAAQVDGDPPVALPPRSARAARRTGAPLTLTDRATDRRWGFRCSP